MATIVTKYNPWREQMALGFLAPIIQNAIQRGIDGQRTAKEAAYMGGLMDAQNGSANVDFSNVQPQSMNPAQYGTGGDAWQNTANAMIDRGLQSGFDNALAPYTEPVQTTKRDITIADIMRPLTTRRFGNYITPERAMQLAGPLLQEQEARKAAEQEAERQRALAAYTDDLRRSAPNEWGHKLILGNITGQVPKEALQYGLGYAEKTLPQYKSEDIGSTLLGLSYSPLSGTAEQIFNVPVSMSPRERAQTSVDWARLAETAKHNRAMEGYRGQEVGRSGAANRLTQDAEGNFILINPVTGAVTQTGARGALKGQGGDWTAGQTRTAQAQMLRTQIQELNKDARAIESDVYIQPGDKQRRLDAINTQRADLIKQWEALATGGPLMAGQPPAAPAQPTTGGIADIANGAAGLPDYGAFLTEDDEDIAGMMNGAAGDAMSAPSAIEADGDASIAEIANGAVGGAEAFQGTPADMLGLIFNSDEFRNQTLDADVYKMILDMADEQEDAARMAGQRGYGGAMAVARRLAELNVHSR